MTPPNDRFLEPPNRPDPELLAGYADGELTGPQRGQVRAWVANDPVAANELDQQRSLSRRRRRFWRTTAPRDPGAATWVGVLARIELALASRAPALAAPPPAARWTAGRVGRIAAAAAAVALVVGAPIPRRPAIQPTINAPVPAVAPAGSPTPEPFAMLAENDVDILSARPADSAILLVGALPVPKDLDLVSAADVTLGPPQPDAGGPMILPAPHGE